MIFNGLIRGKSGKFVTKLMKSYLLIIMIWIAIILIIGSYFINKLKTDDAVAGNNKSLLQFSSMADDYIMKNMKDVSTLLYEDCQSQSFLYDHMTAHYEKQIVDTLKIKSYLDTMLTLNPMIESLALYYPKNDLLVTNYVILYPGKENKYMGELLASFRDMSQFAGSYTWFSDSKYLVNPVLDTLAKQAETNSQPEIIQAIHFARKVPAIDNAGETGCVLFVTLREDYLLSMLQPQASRGYSKLIISDDKGVIAAHTDGDMINKPVADLPYGQLFSEATNHVSNYFATDEDTKVVVSLYRSELTDWVYASVVSLNNLSSMIILIIQMLGLTILFASIIALILASVYTKNLYLPLRKLVYTCTRLSPQIQPEHLNEYQFINSTLDTLQIKMKQHQLIQEKSQVVLKQEYMKELFNQENPPAPPIPEWLNSLGLSFDHPDCCAFIIKIKQYVGMNDDNLRFFAHECAIHFEDKFNTDESVCLASVCDYAVLLLVNYSQIHLSQAGLIDKILCLDIDGTPLSVSLFSGTVVTLDTLQISVDNARRAAAYHFLLPESNCIRYEDIRGREDAKLPIDRNLQKELTLQLKTLNHTKAITALDNLISNLRNSSCSLDYARRILQTTANLVIESINNESASQDQEQETYEIMARLEAAQDIFEYKNILSKALDAFFQGIEDQHSERNLTLVNKAKEYMQQNISSTQLSLNDVADFIGISSSHFSRIFKKETGMSFLDYVTDYKLDYCRNLLVTTDTKIEQISNQLGYSTPQYFANRFKIKYGCTPKDYRFRSRQ
ncbi:MAG: AraC family transcriptional regulator [Clostridiaceae bacterium]|nr:AraC family transcriptional regulator [Clostridiaceae bacterium]